MRKVTLVLALTLLAAPGVAQAPFRAPAPRPARLLWTQVPAEPFAPEPRSEGATLAATAIGGAVGATLGYLAVRLGESIARNLTGSGATASDGLYWGAAAVGGLIGMVIGSSSGGAREGEP